MEDHTSFAKLVAHAQTRELLGAHIIGPQASTLIQQLISGMTFGQTVDQMAHDQFYIHPAALKRPRSSRTRCWSCSTAARPKLLLIIGLSLQPQSTAGVGDQVDLPDHLFEPVFGRNGLVAARPLGGDR